MGGLNYIVWIILFSDSKNVLEPLGHLLWINNTDDGLPIAGALWFITALFWVDVIYFSLRKLISSNLLLNMIIASISVWGNVRTRIIPFELPFSLGSAFVGVGLYHIGSILRKYSDRGVINKILNLQGNILFGLCCIPVIVIPFCEEINMRKGIYPNVLLFWINSVLCSICLINISKKIQKKKELFLLNFICRCLSDIGKNSMIYVGLNQLVILFVNWWIENFIIRVLITMFLLWLIVKMKLFGQNCLQRYSVNAIRK